MARHSRSKNGALSHAYVLAIHVFELWPRSKDVDARDKRGHDAGVWAGRPTHSAHPRESGGPGHIHHCRGLSIPAFAGMSRKMGNP
jgi:hypothetical protein